MFKILNQDIYLGFFFLLKIVLDIKLIYLKIYGRSDGWTDHSASLYNEMSTQLNSESYYLLLRGKPHI